MSGPLHIRFEEVVPPRFSFRVERLLGEDEAFPLDARFAFRVLVDAFAAMERQPSDGNALRRRVEGHPQRETFLFWSTEPRVSDAKHVAALAADSVKEMKVERHNVEDRDDGTYEIATFWVALDEADASLLSHCVPGFRWSTTRV